MNQNRRELLKLLGAGALASAWVPGLADRVRAGRAPLPRIKIGQIGVGHAHASKLSAFRESADFEVVGIVEPDAELRSRAESQEAFRGLPWMTQEQLLNVPGLQAVLVETRVPDLLDTAELCIAAGKHIHLDKPAGESLPQFRRILDAAAQQKLLVQMGYMYRYNPGMVMLREFLAARLARRTVRGARRDEQGRRSGQPQGTCQVSPAGSCSNWAATSSTWSWAMLGKPSKVTPYARHSGNADDNLVDNMLAVFEYERALATVKSTALEVEGGERRHLVVCGTEGTFQIQPLDDPAVRVSLSTARDKYRRGYQEISLCRSTRATSTTPPTWPGSFAVRSPAISVTTTI